VYRVSVILHAKEVWFSLEVIRGMLTAQDPTVRTAILRRHQSDLVRRVAAAKDSLRLIECALECEHEDFTVRALPGHGRRPDRARRRCVSIVCVRSSSFAHTTDD